MNMNPAAVAAARTRRLVREATTPVYTTSTPQATPVVEDRLMVVELDGDYGRSRHTMRDSEVGEFLARSERVGDFLSDLWEKE